MPDSRCTRNDLDEQINCSISGQLLLSPHTLYITMDTDLNVSSTQNVMDTATHLGQVEPNENAVVNPNSNNNNNASNNGITLTSQTHTELQRKQFIQKQLVLLLHAHKCQKREENDKQHTGCNISHCNTMKNVLQHMTQCQNHQTCPVPHCVTSRQIILHWKNCKNTQCPICQILRSPPASLTPPHHQKTSAKEWSKCVTAEMRNDLVQKIISALIPTADINVSWDERMINLANYAQRIENETYDISNNQEEYFHKLAEAVYKIHKDLEDRRERIRQLEQQQQQTGKTITTTLSSTSYTDPLSSGHNIGLTDGLAGEHGPPNDAASQSDIPSFSLSTRCTDVFDLNDLLLLL
ncbi:unnamed protein product [Didymodactylos carnosus]|uniref:histone acetyltransferase n=1 Tax=Didymodactylos carnosus TaxID=1234261 RepID=A0A814Z4Z3_9BILA|nr:unnamed protein product [Didymodactylos carnosus]CAF1238216.1 unnamed protein product [Didymodactylos carnosus]CAF3531560.1 unnamed protein product [Didymodactylos carnosus]CAF4000450.1 unnamed protein product [Didymodactylos carnosus]